MKTATIHTIKKELLEKSHLELVEIALRLGKFKKENKELLTYLLFEQENEDAYIEGLKEILKEKFEEIKTKNVYYAKKEIRKSLRELKKFIRFSSLKTTEIELIIDFIKHLDELPSQLKRDSQIEGIKLRNITSVKKIILKQHEDLQFDYFQMLGDYADE